MLNDQLLQPDLGVKTKTQLVAEKSVFKVLLTTIVAASAEPDLIDPKDDFVINVCRHFAMIFHVDSSSSSASAGSSSLGGPLLASNANASSRLKNNNPSDLKELDSLLYDIVFL